MTSYKNRHIAEAMLSRLRQWKLRLGMAAAIAAVFFPVTGWVFAISWLAVYGILQAIESWVQPGGRFARWVGNDRYSLACLGLTFVNNGVFGLFGAQQILGGTVIGLTCGPMLLAGAILNAVMVSPASRPIMVAAVLPQILYISLLPIGALTRGDTPLQAIQITLGALLLTTAALAAWIRLSKTLHALEEAQARAEQANRAKTNFLATMSHEIRTPLNGVLGMAQAMAADDLQDRQRERLNVISHSGQALLVLLNDVLDLAKIEAGQMVFEFAEFDMTSLVERSQETFRTIADEKGVALRTRINPNAAGSWSGDPTRLRQVLSNLISNAVKFTDEGEICVGVDAFKGGLRFVVEDTGPGVTKEQLPRLFKKFVQADASTTRKYGGTGLGLSICGELADLMGGSITAHHVDPHGLRFIFDAPLQRVEAKDRGATVGLPSVLDELPVGRGTLRVLAAEDHPVNQQVLTVLLGQAGIVPYIVENGVEAVEAWRAGSADGPWDLILMDVQMPVMDGPTAARMIRSEERAAGRPPVPIVALTANIMTHQVEEYREAGMDTFVAKPIQVEALLAGIKAAVGA